MAEFVFLVTMELTLNHRQATARDAGQLAVLNHRLIADEDHRNSMSVAELQQRMADWLTSGGYRAVLFEVEGETVGYALYRRESDHVYLRQFYIERHRRRQGLGKMAFAWLKAHAWQEVGRLRVDVLVNNTAGVAFWRAMGMRDYCLTLETNQL